MNCMFGVKMGASEVYGGSHIGGGDYPHHVGQGQQQVGQIQAKVTFEKLRAQQSALEEKLENSQLEDYQQINNLDQWIRLEHLLHEKANVTHLDNYTSSTVPTSYSINFHHESVLFDENNELLAHLKKPLETLILRYKQGKADQAANKSWNDSDMQNVRYTQSHQQYWDTLLFSALLIGVTASAPSDILDIAKIILMKPFEEFHLPDNILIYKTNQYDTNSQPDYQTTAQYWLKRGNHLAISWQTADKQSELRAFAKFAEEKNLSIDFCFSCYKEAKYNGTDYLNVAKECYGRSIFSVSKEDQQKIDKCIEMVKAKGTAEEKLAFGEWILTRSKVMNFPSEKEVARFLRPTNFKAAWDNTYPNMKNI